MYDLIVIGAGAAGMTSALYALRNSKKVLVLESESLGGQIATSPRLENFPSIKAISGEQFADNLFEQITALGCEVEIEKAVGIEKLADKTFVIKTEFNEYKAKSVIIASGVKHKHLRTKSNRDDLVGKGVYYTLFVTALSIRVEKLLLLAMRILRFNIRCCFQVIVRKFTFIPCSINSSAIVC